MSKEFKEKSMTFIFFLSAIFSVVSVFLISFFIFSNALPAFKDIGFLKFLSGRSWRPLHQEFGIFTMIIGSLYVTAGAILVGVPIAIFTAVFIEYYCPKKFKPLVTGMIDLLAGIPSVVFGFFGLVVIVPLIQHLTGTSGKGVLTASLLLGIMILPTIINVILSELRSIPKTYYQGSLALGASHEQSIFKVVLPAARSGVFAGVVLGIGRAIGETMAVIMVAGNQTIIPCRLTHGVRTLTANIVLEMGYATGLHRSALIATAAVLFVFILIINISFSALKGAMNHEK